MKVLDYVSPELRSVLRGEYERTMVLVEDVDDSRLFLDEAVAWGFPLT